MALITGIPNFFNAATPTSTDVNNAAKAIATQIGATYYDVGAAGYVSAPANLDTNNLSTNASLKNTQKAESFSHFTLTMEVVIGAAPGGSGTPVTRWSHIPIFPPLGYPYFLTALNISSGGFVNLTGISSQYASLNSVTPSPALAIAINDSVVTTIIPGNQSETSGKPMHFPLGTIPVGPTDTVLVDISSLIMYTLAAGTDGYMELVLTCKTPHIRSNP